MTTLIFEPHDSLFFRDGRPFNQGESCAGLVSLFPPSPLTLVGAARSAWAVNMGWSGRGPWAKQLRPEQLNRLGGDGEELQGLCFRGPLLLRRGGPLFPVPANLLGRRDGNGNLTEIVRLVPDKERRHCDLGDGIYLPAPEGGSDVKGCKPLSGCWLDKQGFSAVLDGEIPATTSCLSADSLWRNEPRVGISINDGTGMVEESALYSIQHVRLLEDVTMAMQVDGDLTEFPDDTLVALGGEARYCRLRKPEHEQLQIPAATFAQDTRFFRYCVHVLTPLKPDRPPRAGADFTGLPGRVVSCCLPRPQRWGGWDGVNHRPLPMCPHLPPGSVLFMKVETREELDDALRLHGRSIGLRGSWGFGLIAIGQW